MAKLTHRLARIERSRHAALLASRPPVCRYCAGIDRATGCGPIHGCTRLDRDGLDLVICRMCPRAWLGRLERQADGRLVVTNGVPAETPY